MAGGILSLIPGLGIAGTVDCLILWWYEWICERFGELPGAVWCVGRPAKWQMVVYYSGLFVLIIGRNYAEKWKRQRLYAAYVAEIIMETDTTLKEKGSVGKHAEWMIALGVEKERATEKRCSILTGTLKYVPPDGGMF